MTENKDVGFTIDDSTIEEQKGSSVGYVIDESTLEEAIGGQSVGYSVDLSPLDDMEIGESISGTIGLGEYLATPMSATTRASGTLTGSGSYVYLVISWSGTKTSTGSTVSATLYAQNASGTYFQATVRNGYSVTINGSSKSGTTATLSTTSGGRATLISHSTTVTYTGNKSITISGTANMSNIVINGSTTIGTRNVSGTCALDFNGSNPTMGSIKTPATGYHQEGASTISVSWNAGTSDAGTITYYVEYSLNSGAWTALGSTTGTSYNHSVNIGMGGKIQYRVRAKNTVGYSGYNTSGTLTMNTVYNGTLSAPSTYNPYTANGTISFNVATTGSQNISGTVTNNVHLYHGSTFIASGTRTGTGAVNIAFSSATVLGRLGTTKASDTFRVAIYSTNHLGTRASGENWYNFTVNINTDNGALPTISGITTGGGSFGHTATCYIAGHNTISVSFSGAVQRAPSGTTLSYSTTLAGQTKSGSSVSFTGVSAGKHTITSTVTDSRGLARSTTHSIRVQSYSRPSLSVTGYGRLSSPTTTGYVNYSTGYTAIYAYSTNSDTQGSQLNSIHTQQRSLNGGAWTAYTSGTHMTGLGNDLAYPVKIRVSDAFSSGSFTEASVVIPTVKSNFSIRKHGIGINCIPQSGRALDVSGNGYVDGGLTVSGGISNSSGSVWGDYGGSASISSSNGWRTLYEIEYGDSNGSDLVYGGSAMLTISRSYNSPNNESGTFLITGAYQNTKIVQLAGAFNSRLFTNVRVTVREQSGSKWLFKIEGHISNNPSHANTWYSKLYNVNFPACHTIRVANFKESSGGGTVRASSGDTFDGVVYNNNNRPTASVVGALPISGGTLTGAVTSPTDFIINKHSIVTYYTNAAKYGNSSYIKNSNGGGFYVGGDNTFRFENSSGTLLTTINQGVTTGWVDINGATASVLAFVPSNGVSIIDFRNTGSNNDRGWIKHFNASTNAAVMEFCVSDDPNDRQDYFRWGAATGNGSNVNATMGVWGWMDRGRFAMRQVVSDQTAEYRLENTSGTIVGNMYIPNNNYNLHIRSNGGSWILARANSGMKVRNEAESAYTPCLASAFTVNSEKKWKTNIEEVKESALSKINSTSIFSYDKLEGDETKRHEIGLIIENGVPEELILEVERTDERTPEEKEDGVVFEKGVDKFIDLYSMLSMNWKASQELSDQDDAMEADITYQEMIMEHQEEVALQQQADLDYQEMIIESQEEIITQQQADIDFMLMIMEG